MIKQFVYRIRLFRRVKKEPYFALFKILGFFPNKIDLYEEALLHKSSSKENKDGRHLNNERLEFLGDAILDAIIADIAFKRFPAQNEGFLTTTRSKIVKRETLDKVACELGLHKLIVSAAHNRGIKNHILGNALEAFIGAIYLDQGYEKTLKFVESKIIKPYINIDKLAKKEVNFKSKLLEWCQKYRVTMDFELLENYTDSEYNPIFQSQALLNGLLAGIGIGYSKKESHQQAAQMSLKKIKTDKTFVKEILASNKKKEAETDAKEKENAPTDAF